MQCNLQSIKIQWAHYQQNEICNQTLFKLHHCCSRTLLAPVNNYQK